MCRFITQDHKQILATIISRVFEPLAIALFLFYLAIINLEESTVFWAISFILVFIIPISILSYYAYRNRDIDLKNREVRNTTYLLITPSITVAFLHTLLYGSTEILKIALLIFAGFTLIHIANRFIFKISIHMVGITALSISLFVLTESVLLLAVFLPLILLLGWARHSLGVHTIPELVGGFTLPILMVLIYKLSTSAISLY